MRTNSAHHRVRYDVDLMAKDMAERGWDNRRLAKAAEVSEMTVSRFLSNKRQRAPMAKKLADALGRSVRRYIILDAKPATKQAATA